MKIFFVFFTVLILLIAVILSLTILFPIKKITTKGSRVYTNQEIIKNCGIEVNDNLFTVSEKEVLNKLKAKLPFVETVEIERLLPDSLNIKITDAKEYACYQIGEKYFTVSQSGWVLREYIKKPDNIVLVISDKVSCKTGEVIEFQEGNSHSVSQTIIDELVKMNVSVDSVDITEKTSLKAKIEGRFIVNFGTSVDLIPKIKHLNSMLEKIGKNDTGIINLSMWNSQNTQGTFVQNDIK